jgi:hypothetical protein
MSVDQGLLEILTNYSNENSLECHLYLNETIFELSDVSITHSSTPVNEPTTRGGVYFSDKFAYKMKGEIKDLSVIPLLTNKMLGPNTEFGELRITAKIEFKGEKMNIEIFTNLTNSVQTPNSIELSMIIIKLNTV